MKSDRKIPVSVVIPGYNCELTIDNAISSVLSQSLRPDEIILINDNSSDSTLTIMSNYKNLDPHLFVLVSNEFNVGAGESRNLGIRLSKNQLVAFLDADDLWHPLKLEIQYNYMKNNADIDLSGHRVGGPDDVFEEYILFNNDTFAITFQKLLFKNYFNTPSVMLKKRNLFFPIKQRYAEDYFLWLNYAFNGYKIRYIKHTLAKVNKPFFGHSGLSSNMLNMYEYEVKNITHFLFLKDNNRKILTIIALIFSLFKFIRRLVKVFYNKVFFWR